LAAEMQGYKTRMIKRDNSDNIELALYSVPFPIHLARQ